MRGEEAKALCPDFQTFYVSQKRGKADLTKYRNASLKIFEIISKYSKINNVFV
jgi:DNA polymerase eta